MRGSIVRSLIRFVAQFPMASIFKQMLGIFVFSLVIVGLIAFLHYKYGFNITLEKETTFFNYYESKIRG
ncbi:hypothetical protein D6O72_18545, partial [Salmonella enterica]|nr:hypothetical protein [Salmonella enterica]